jgi:putative ABC transport system substrate-binding protein
MKKEIFGLVLGVMLFSLCFPVEAQQPKKVPRVGYLAGAGSAPSQAFLQGLRDLGYVEGQNIALEYRTAEFNAERYPDLAAELVRLKVDIIVADTTGTALAAKKATTTIPIVMTTSSDPVGDGLIASMARPGGNVTGLTNIAGELGGKLLEILKEIVPSLTRVAIVLPGGQADKLFLKETENPARALRVQLISVVARGPEDYERAIRAAIKERANAFLSRLGPRPSAPHRSQFMELAAKSRLPVASGSNLDTEAGGLISYGRDPRESYRRAATYVDKILKGTKPADLPVEAPMKLELVVNLKTAKQIGLTIPPNVLVRADKVIR